MSPTDTDNTTPGRPDGPHGWPGPPAARVVRAAIWLPGLAVALGAAAATAHGLYEVAAAARVPAGIAWLYPLITDGLALVAYAATARLTGSAARYAWSVVVLAAGLSGLAQAAYLASGSTVDAPPALRFGVGAWPAIAAAIVAHLLYLLAVDQAPDAGAEPVAAEVETPDDTAVAALAALAAGAPDRSAAPVQPEPLGRTTTDPVQPAVPPSFNPPAAVVQPPALDDPAIERSTPAAEAVEQPVSGAAESPARDRARAAAARHAHRHGALPTVTQLEAIAQVSRGTAAAALKALREQPSPLRLVHDPTEPRTQP